MATDSPLDGSRQSTAAPPLPTLIRTPDQRVRVFVSSTLDELAPERAAAREAITQLRLTPVFFEAGARPYPPRELYRAYLAQSDIFIGLYWQRYGWVAPGMQVSGLEDEYQLSRGKPRLIYIKIPAPEREQDLHALLDRIRTEDTTSYQKFASPEELREQIANDLAALLTERFTRTPETPADARLASLPVPRSRLIDREQELANEDTALADVAAGLRRVIVEELPPLSASAPRAALPAIWNIPYPRNPFFLGRDHELAQVRHYLQGDQATALSQPQAISGLGGIGKTQLALEYAYRYHQYYQAILWARADSPEALISSYVALATLLQLPEREAKEQEVIVEAVKRWLQTHRGWLLILDNTDELAALPGFLPPTLGGHLLLTTRAEATGRLAHRIEIEILSPEQGALCLLRRSGLLSPDAPLEQALQEEQALAIQISRELGGLPLALDQAGAYLEETGTSLAEYWQLYQQYRADLLRERRGGLVADHPLPVATTWSVSFQRIEERNMGAAELLRLLAWLPPDAVAEEILPAGAAFLGPMLAPIAGNAMLLNQAIEALRAYSLVRRDPRAQTLSMHRLVQAVLQDQQEQEERRTWAERAMRAVNAAFPHAEYGTWAQCERLLPLALAAAASIEQQQLTFKEAGRLLYEAASYLQDRARYGEAEPLYQCALRIREQQLGPECPQVATSLTNLAVLYFEQGKYGEAEPLYQRALRIREQQLGPEHPHEAYPLTGLADLYREQGKYGEAEPLYQRALRIREQQLGPEHPKTRATHQRLTAL